MAAFKTPKHHLRLKDIRVENGDQEELQVCPNCNGKGKAPTKSHGNPTSDNPFRCENCKGAGMVKVSHG
jgi:DnaJ-class molecular chaperone